MKKVSIFKSGKHQAVRLPKEMEFQGISELAITKVGDVIILRPVPAGRKLGELKSILEALPRLTPQEAEDFEKDLEQIRKEGNREMLGDPWA